MLPEKSSDGGLCVFEVIFIVYFPKWKTIKGEFYANLLQRFNDEIEEKISQLEKQKTLSLGRWPKSMKCGQI